jgi:hypothetical protein
VFQRSEKFSPLHFLCNIEQIGGESKGQRLGAPEFGK